MISQLIKLEGVNSGISWAVEVFEAVDARYFAEVTVGKVKKRTEKTYRQTEQAQRAGRILVAQILTAVKNGQ